NVGKEDEIVIQDGIDKRIAHIAWAGSADSALISFQAHFYRLKIFIVCLFETDDDIFFYQSRKLAIDQLMLIVKPYHPARTENIVVVFIKLRPLMSIHNILKHQWV